MADLAHTDLQARHEQLHRFSHDLKNKLGALWQAAKLLHELPPGPEHDQLIAMAENSYFAGARAVERLLDDFSVPRGVETPGPEPVDLVPLLETCAASMGFRTGPKQQRFIILAEVNDRVLADRGMLVRLLEALFSNASKFSPTGAEINVSAKVLDHTVRLTVEDPGVGLSETDLQDVFTRYAMLSSRTTGGESQARSTLHRARQWAVVQGGDLRATSNGPGKGSAFTLTLPVAR